MVWGNVIPGVPQVGVPQTTNKPVIAIGITHREEITMQWGLRMLGPLLFVGVSWCDKLHLLARGYRKAWLGIRLSPWL